MPVLTEYILTLYIHVKCTHACIQYMYMYVASRLQLLATYCMSTVGIYMYMYIHVRSRILLPISQCIALIDLFCCQ